MPRVPHRTVNFTLCRVVGPWRPRGIVVASFVSEGQNQARAKAEVQAQDQDQDQAWANFQAQTKAQVHARSRLKLSPSGQVQDLAPTFRLKCRPRPSPRFVHRPTFRPRFMVWTCSTLDPGSGSDHPAHVQVESLHLHLRYNSPQDVSCASWFGHWSACLASTGV